MNWKKIFHTIALNLRGSAPQRAAYIREKNLFGFMGENVSYSPRKLPLYPNLIRIHDNVSLAAGVQFITHDISDNVVNKYLESMGRRERITEKIGCIEIMDNVFVGADTTILYDVRIGENCIIGAGSLVSKDIPAGSVAVGIPCKVIGTFADFVEKRLAHEQVEAMPHVRGVSIPKETAERYWQAFEEAKRIRKKEDQK